VKKTEGRNMGLELKNRMSVRMTAVSNEFIDTYMAAANGEYVKVFLYLLRHEGEEITVSLIADALNHTEADVKRALAYWRNVGILEEEMAQAETGRGASLEERAARARKTEAVREEWDREAVGKETGSYEIPDEEGVPERKGLSAAVRAAKETTAANEITVTSQTDKKAGLLEVPDMGDTYERLERLSGDEEFSALLYVAQQYLEKTFTPIECEKFAFFYDGLKMSGELLEYLAEYCADGGHKSIRYIEKVALNWYQLGIKTKEQAQECTVRYSREMSAVMKAFGLTNRSLATAEQEYIKRWFHEYAFDSKIVTEACSRTIKATGAASFPYADKILAGWKESGVKTVADVAELDKKHQLKKQAQGRETTAGNRSGGAKRTSGTNRFKNFEERSYNYEDYVWEGMRKRQQKGGTGDGTQ